MKIERVVTGMIAVLLAGPAGIAGSNPNGSGVPMVITVLPAAGGSPSASPDASDFAVLEGKSSVPVVGLQRLAGDLADMQLFVLLDDSTRSSSLGTHLAELKTFLNSLPSTTQVAVGYMRNGTVQVAQNLTNDHDRAARAIRLPLASGGAFGSPYLSVIDLMKRWPENSNRREIVMITDGIDRFRSEPRHRGIRSISPDVDSASVVAQRTGTMIHTIFTRGVGLRGRDFWEITNGQNGMAKLSDETGGESFFLGTHNAVSFRPYLESLQRSLGNRYLLEFNAVPGNKAGLKNVKLTTEVAGVELDSADSVWVRAR